MDIFLNILWRYFVFFITCFCISFYLLLVLHIFLFIAGFAYLLPSLVRNLTGLNLNWQLFVQEIVNKLDHTIMTLFVAHRIVCFFLHQNQFYSQTLASSSSCCWIKMSFILAPLRPQTSQFQMLSQFCPNSMQFLDSLSEPAPSPVI